MCILNLVSGLMVGYGGITHYLFQYAIGLIDGVVTGAPKLMISFAASGKVAAFHKGNKQSSIKLKALFVLHLKNRHGFSMQMLGHPDAQNIAIGVPNVLFNAIHVVRSNDAPI